MTGAKVVNLADYRGVTPQERLEAIVSYGAGVLGHGDPVALDVLHAIAAALSDLRPTEHFGLEPTP